MNERQPRRYRFTATKEDVCKAINGIPWALSNKELIEGKEPMKRKVSVMPENMTSEYQRFIRSKVRSTKSFGFAASEHLNGHLFDWQRRIVDWALRRGRAAIFADCGLGKTLMQLEWASKVHQHSGGNVLLHCPIGVREQTLREAAKFEIDCNVYVADSMDDVKPGIALVNYEKIHKFETTEFVGVVLDESSILKNFTGTTKRSLVQDWKHADYRLACTATPAPNDHMELGNHAEFLGIMPSNEMLSRWFINDTMKAGGYRLKSHGQRDFWHWVTTWAACICKPSDIGGNDSGYELPEMHEHLHVVTDEAKPADGFLFNNFALNATNVHKQKRNTAQQRAELVASIVDVYEPWVVWCDTNYEADELKKAIPTATEVRGSDSDKSKQQKLTSFTNGDINTLITKPSVAGLGMNWQHCSHTAFVGLSYSFEAFYQAVRRFYRFGQSKPVNVHIIEGDGESSLREATLRKRQQFEQMQRGMAEAVQGLQLQDEIMRETYEPTKKMELPQWLT
jgi:hypothetical protein